MLLLLRLLQLVIRRTCMPGRAVLEARLGRHRRSDREIAHSLLRLDMLLGRREVVALVLVLYPWSCFGKRSE